MVCMVFIIALPTLEYCFFRTPDICWSYQVVSPDQCKKKKNAPRMDIAIFCCLTRVSYGRNDAF